MTASRLADLPAMHRPPTAFPLSAQDYPFSFMPTCTAPELSPVILDMWTHDASVSLPSSSGGLKALLNTPRMSLKLWDHRKTNVSFPDDSAVNGLVSDEVSPSSTRQTRASRTPKRSAGRSTPYSKNTTSHQTDSSFPNSSPLQFYSPSARLPTISPVVATTEVEAATVPPKAARLEAERGRRGDLREKFAKLRDKLPMDGQKGSKVNILDRGKRFVLRGISCAATDHQIMAFAV